jgi:hypothetical protein
MNNSAFGFSTVTDEENYRIVVIKAIEEHRSMSVAN